MSDTHSMVMFCNHCHESVNCPKLASTLLEPTLPRNVSGTEHGRKALMNFKQGMCRDRDRLQRVERLTDALSYVSNFREALFWRGILDVKNVKNNILDLQNALRLTDEMDTQYYVILSQIQAMKRNVDRAIVYLDKAMALAKNDGDKGEVHYFRSFAYWWIDKDDESMSDCKKTIKYCYNSKSSYAQLGDVYHYCGKTKEETEDMYLKSLEPVPNYLELISYGNYLKRTSRTQEALTVYRQAISRNPHSYLAYEAMISISQNQESDAYRGIQLDRYGKAITCRQIYAILLSQKNQMELAINVLNEGIEIANNSEWYCLRGQLCQQLAIREPFKYPLYDEIGLVDIRKAVSIDPSNPEYQFWMYMGLTDDDRIEKKQRIRNVIYLSPTYPRLNLTQSDIAEILNDSSLPEFKLFRDEHLGLVRTLEEGTAYQYQGTTRNVISLLSKFHDTDAMKYYLFKNYYDQVYTWSSNPLPTIALPAQEVLIALEQPNNFVPNMDLEKDNNWTDITVRCNSRSIRLNKIVLREWDYSSLLNEDNEIEFPHSFESLDFIVSYLYRKPHVINATQLIEVMEITEEYHLTELYDFIRDDFESYSLQHSKCTKTILKCREEVRFDFSEIPKNFNISFDNRDNPYSDLEISFSDVTYYTHKCIVSSCDYIRNILGSGMMESSTSSIKMSTITSDIFLEVLNYLYGIPVNFTLDNCVEILRAADNLQLEDLRILSVLFIVGKMDSSDLEDLLYISEHFNSPRLKRHCQHLLNNP